MKFEEIAAHFAERTQRIVWCTVATVDRAGRPRTRISIPSGMGPRAGLRRDARD